MQTPDVSFEQRIQELWTRQYFGNSGKEWVIALGIALAATLALGLFKRLIEHRLARLAEKTETDIDDMLIDLVRRTRRLYLVALGLWIGSHYLEPSARAYAVLMQCLKLGTAIQVGFWAVGLVDYGVGKLTRGGGGEYPARAMGAHVLSLIGRALVWVGVGLVVLSVLMQEAVTTLLTGLGVGGIAVALALQNVLGDLFASITILLDKPFVIGDAISVGDFTGTVEQIGIKTTRLKSVNGEQIIMGNSDLVHSRIRNFKRLEERRSLFSVGVTYDTPPEVLQRLPAMLKEIVEKTPLTRFDRAHFARFADSALVFETAYFVQKPDYQSFMDTQQAINFEILRRFEREGIQFAYPTQVVYHAPASASPR